MSYEMSIQKILTIDSIWILKPLFIELINDYSEKPKALKEVVFVSFCFMSCHGNGCPLILFWSVLIQ